jgi:hypothetical protein
MQRRGEYHLAQSESDLQEQIELNSFYQNDDDFELYDEFQETPFRGN